MKKVWDYIREQAYQDPWFHQAIRLKSSNKAKDDDVLLALLQGLKKRNEELVKSLLIYPRPFTFTPGKPIEEKIRD